MNTNEIVITSKYQYFTIFGCLLGIALVVMIPLIFGQKYEVRTFGREFKTEKFRNVSESFFLKNQNY